MDVVRRINMQQLQWLGHVVRTEEDAPARRVFDVGICRSRRRGRTCIRLNYQTKERPVIDLCDQLDWARKNRKGAWKHVLRLAEIR